MQQARELTRKDEEKIPSNSRNIILHSKQALPNIWNVNKFCKKYTVFIPTLRIRLLSEKHSDINLRSKDIQPLNTQYLQQA
mgnify:CR=1 FL=1